MRRKKIAVWPPSIPAREDPLHVRYVRLFRTIPDSEPVSTDAPERPPWARQRREEFSGSGPSPSQANGKPEKAQSSAAITNIQATLDTKYV